MYKGFNLDLQNEYLKNNEFLKVGNYIYEKQREQIQSSLKQFQNMGNVLSGQDIIKNWFPEVEADIFLSHSHRDKDKVIRFAGWLKKHFGLTSFIDSTVWGYANDLLEIIDNEYCKQPNGYFDYQKRNYSTSHVHMMLSISLFKMIDKCECIIFINTPQSFTPKQDINNGITLSPWIFSEISMTKMIRIQKPKRLITDSSLLSTESFNDSLKIEYLANMEHLISLDVDMLEEWKIKNNKQGNSSLDILYELTKESNVIYG